MPRTMTGTETNDDGGWIRAAVARYEGPLVRYAARITGDLERARDVVQDTFLRLCQQRRSDVDGHLAQWLYTVCRRRALDVRRKEARMKTLTDRAAAAQPSRGSDQATAAEQQDTVAVIQRLVETLPENQQEVVRLKFQNSLSYRQISQVTGLSVSNVGYLIHTAIQKIRKTVLEPHAEGSR